MINIIFFLLVSILCLARWKGYCGTCEGSKSADIFQIALTGLLIVPIVGVLPVVKLTIIILFSSMARYVFGKLTRKEVIKNGFNKIKKDCCEDNFY